MKKLIRIKLINWHLFANQTINIQNNCLLSGENGAGKSTFLDALQYVLTGGRAKFNTAANQSAKRNLEGYIRCKLGIENKTYLRSQDVTSHIALEFYDDNTEETFILGVIIEMNKTGHIYERFYALNNMDITDDLYIEQSIIRGYVQFKKYLQSIDANVIFCDTKEKTRQLFLQYLGIKNEKYIELIPKALAFKPINELNKFVYDFLLNEKNVSIDELRQNVRSYREFENLIMSLQEKEVSLNEIIDIYKIYQQETDNKELYDKLQEYIEYERILSKEKQLEEDIKKTKLKIKETHHNQFIVDETVLNLNKDIERIRESLNDDESYQYLKNVAYQLEESKIQQKKQEALVKEIQTMFESEKKLGQAIYDHIIKEPCLINMRLNASSINQTLLLYDTLKESLYVDINQLKIDKKKIEDELISIDNDERKLHRNEMKFSKQVERLKEVIELEIKKTLEKNTKVYSLCELTEVRDENWRNALEGYLNTQRFDLIIEPQYFDIALKAYEENKKQENIYGVGLVNTKALTACNEVSEHSLASKLKCRNQDALKYVAFLLNHVRCCEDLEELKQYKTSITKTCMVYKNHTARQIHPAVYEKPYIGSQAIKIQLNHLKQKKEQLKQQQQDIEEALSLKSFYLDRIKRSQLMYIQNNIDAMEYLNLLKQKINDLTEKSKRVQMTDNLTQLNEELEKNNKEIKKLEEDKRQLLLEEGKLNGDIENKTEQLMLIREEKSQQKIINDVIVRNNYEVICEQFSDFKKMIQYCDKEIKRIEENLKATKKEMVKKMNQYNIDYHVGFSPSVDGISDYQNELYRIRDYELIKYQDQAREARINCEIAFKEQFIYKLRENMLNAQQELIYLNQALKDKKFGGDEYEFIYQPSLNQDYRLYYDLIMNKNDELSESLFTDGMSNENQVLLKELFEKLVIDARDEMAEKTLAEFCDYRNYMSYDIKIHHKNGETTYFSKVSREKSGGETQTPFYVVIAASFEQLITNKNQQGSPACFVMFDEAFNNMDESRIRAMMSFYSQLNIQLMISVPPQRIDTIIQSVNTTLVVMKDGHQSFIETFTYKKDANQ